LNQIYHSSKALVYKFAVSGIKFETEKKIEGLKNDSKKYRIADFYLPKYKVYVEFFGLWNNAGNEEYRQKKDVYWKNNIPCIYIYPENLGIIGYTFDKRIQMVFEKFSMKNEHRKYKKHKLMESGELKNRGGILIICIISLCIAFFSVGVASLDWSIVISVALIALYQVDSLYDLYMDIFKRNKYSLDNL
jgi:hypothetical protein